MAKKKKYAGDEINTRGKILPPDQFLYEENDVVLIGSNLLPGHSGLMTPQIISPAIFLSQSLKKIRDWLITYGLQNDDVLANRVQGLASVISIDSGTRQKLYSVFRKIQLDKLQKNIEAIRTAMNLIWSDGLQLQAPYDLLKKQEQVFSKYFNQLESQHTDVHKLLYHELYPVVLHFDEVKIKRADQDRMLRDLFRLFEYEDFAMKVTDQSMVNRAKKINNSTRDWFSKI